MDTLRLTLPATSANLGPGFDALGLAMRLYLQIEASAAAEFAIAATGRNAELVGELEKNLMVETYRELAKDGPALDLKIENGIPLGMGCGSSAAALVAGVMLANHFGRLGMAPEDVVAEASRREGHPDNVAACYYGGLTASAMAGGKVTAATFGAELPWRLLLVLPGEGLATTKARAMLPESYRKSEVVTNIQATALLVSAFALNRPELLAAGTRDCIHQPYRESACPLLPRLLPMVGKGGVYSVTLSGAGPSVLLMADPGVAVEGQIAEIRAVLQESEAEIVETRISGGVTLETLNR